MKRTIRSVAVLGSGVMGSRIACHFAGIGLQVLLLDIVPAAAASSEPSARNQLVNDALQSAVKSNPSPLFHKEALRRIQTGNFEDDLARIATCDWVIEVVVERLDIKRQLFEQIERYRKKGTLITSNTSGIPIHLMAEGRTDDFRKHFCGTHFFNPPRYLRLLEIIPTPETDPEIVDFLMQYGDLYLGKTTVLCKDTPAFIANRIGVFGIMAIFRLLDKMGMTVDEVDALTGPIIGRPKSATFRTADVVGIDTMVKVARGVYDHCPDDESRAAFTIPTWLDQMVAQQWLGDKTGQGFFKKTRGAGGEKEILSLNLATLEYGPRQKPKFASVEAAKPIDDLKDRLKALCTGMDKAGEFYRHFHYGLFSYISHRIPEITDEAFRIDDAMMAGFGWEIGAFESWDVLGVAKTVESMKKAGYSVAPWVETMLAAGYKTFYKVERGKRLCYSPASGGYVGTAAPGQESAFIVMRHFEGSTVWKNAAARTYHLGDDVLGLEWYTKMGSIGGEVLEGIQQTISLAEEKYRGVVIANEGPNFSAGANVGMIFMLSIEQEWDEMDMAIRMFQHTMTRARYSSVPVVVAPHGLSLGGACELSLHADKVCPAAETYIGLVEVGIGVIPGGGGTKEFVLRAADEMHEDEPETITLKNRFLSIATAKVATSAQEAFGLGILRKGHDEVVLNPSRRIAEAKRSVLEMHEAGYVMPVRRNDIKVLGRSALGAMYAGVNGMVLAGYATEHDSLVARKLAFVMCGGDLSEPTLVSEQYLLDLEREAFLSLCGEKKTLERIQSVLKSGRPVRN
ncbi:MAG: 3-hydroxyacyl-CoA dehydrogenase/enoyl-CoA hydratase family protein [Bacteroidetes bacterium]|nr:3-hydroxyacyl-CoA dehydrogenase/enoyl-CoA hydratase family protein [Bacteroidota bacterium]